MTFAALGYPTRLVFAVVSALGLVAVRTLGDGPKAPEQPAAKHWSFQPIRHPDVPVVKNSAWVRNPIDSFVLSKLESLGVAPSPPADRVTLIRRLSLDLLGLPPTPAEVDAFVHDSDDGAYDRLVTRLLQSPHFGERWGRHWLDLARYADSDGYEKDSPRPYAYLYRNWVIDAFNRDVAFDQFTREQLAGDLLPGATLEQKIATGFHRNTLTNKEGGVDQEEFRNKANVDRVNTTATVWLGLTLGCCECHNHKYDPFTQKEFYSFFSFFNATIESDVAAPQPAEVAAYDKAKAAFDAEHAQLTAALAQFEHDVLPSRVAAWETSLGGKLPAAHWTTLDPVSATSRGGATLTQQPDGSIQVAGKSPPSDTYTIEIRTELASITAIRLEVLPDPGHPAKGPGRVKHGNFVLNELTVRADAMDGSEPRLLSLQNARADFAQDKFDVAGAVDGKLETGWAVAPQFGQRHAAVFDLKEPLQSHPASAGGAPAPIRLLVTLEQQHGTEHTIGRLRLSATSDTPPVPWDDTPAGVVAALSVAPDQRSQKDNAELAKHVRGRDADWKKLNAAVAEHNKKAPPPPATRAMTISQNPAPPATHVHMRGDFLRKGDAVEPGTPAVLAAFQPAAGCDPKPDADEPRSRLPNRLDLANWLVDRSNTLTARVCVNRVWQHLFGKGLVGTPNDFGTRGEPPSHPDLLDWLASEFVSPTPGAVAAPANEFASPETRHPWSMKDLIRLIVTSNTYCQSSRTRADLAESDPTNALLARQSRYRLEAEVVRDECLAASGLLTPTIGGPSVRPPQPAGVSDLTYAGSVKWTESTGPDRYRRGMYTWFQRTSPYPMLMTFDSPDGVNCTVRRERSNTPLQALTLLNDAVFVECAQSMARRVLKESSGDPQQRVNATFRLCMSRAATTSEAERLLRAYGEFAQLCRSNAESAAKLLGSGTWGDADPAEAAALVAVARTILNLDEFVTRE
jgi:hypothetical protein